MNSLKLNISKNSNGQEAAKIGLLYKCSQGVKPGTTCNLKLGIKQISSPRPKPLCRATSLWYTFPSNFYQYYYY